MHRLTTSWLGIDVSAVVSPAVLSPASLFLTALSLTALSLAVVSCGAPAELDANLYPGRNETGYSDADGTGSTGTPLGGGSAGAGGRAPNLSAESPATGDGGSSSAPPAAAMNGSSPGNSAMAPPAGGGATPSAPVSVAPAPGGSAPAEDGPSAGGCPDDITVLFDRPITEGGCNGDACHIPGRTAPDLVSPGVETRLLNVISQCNGRPYIGAGDSFLADKVAGSPPECGLAMPFFMPQALSAADEQCILDWIDEVSGG